MATILWPFIICIKRSKVDLFHYIWHYMLQSNKMHRYVQFCLIVIGLKLFTAAVIEVHNESPAQNLYCEVFQNKNFDGESVQIPQSQKIDNFNQLTQSWSSSYGSDDSYSIKLPSLIPSGIICVVKSCTSENFDGNCTVFKQSQKIIQSSRVKSFECNCFNEHDDIIIENKNVVLAEISNVGQSTGKQACGTDFSMFQNFTQLGKKIIGVGRNYM